MTGIDHILDRLNSLTNHDAVMDTMRDDTVALLESGFFVNSSAIERIITTQANAQVINLVQQMLTYSRELGDETTPENTVLIVKHELERALINASLGGSSSAIQNVMDQQFARALQVFLQMHF